MSFRCGGFPLRLLSLVSAALLTLVSGVSMAQIKDAMDVIGYNKDDLHQLERWESKRTTGYFGK